MSNSLYIFKHIHMSLREIIENHWYKKNNFLLVIFLYPLEVIFCFITYLRCLLFKIGIFKSYKLPVPVIVIGNISVGGAGKTPLTKHLATELTKLGFNVGIILRGYKGQIKHAHVVEKNDSSEHVGDEALIYAINGFKVAIGSNRYLVGKKLLDTYPDIQLILSDDGLQHYALKRDYEIAVIDQSRMFGNCHCLPMGPLREGIKRLNLVNAIVINGKSNLAIKNIINHKSIFHQTLDLDKIYNPITNTYATPESFKSKNTVALAAIGNPSRFFTLLAQMGISTSKNYEFPDHHPYKLSDIPKHADLILVTEKDYVKLNRFNDDRIWVVLVKSQLDSNCLIGQIQKLI